MRTMTRKPDLLFNVHSLALLNGSDLHFSDEDGDQVLINSCADRNCFFPPCLQPFWISSVCTPSFGPWGNQKQEQNTVDLLSPSQSCCHGLWFANLMLHSALLFCDPLNLAVMVYGLKLWFIHQSPIMMIGDW